MAREQTYREIMGSYPTGVTIITTNNESNEPVGLTVNSFTSVSLDPLMILWCIDKKSGNYETFKRAKSFSVNILAGNQQDACWVFADSTEKDRFSKVEWKKSNNGLPLIEGAFASLECKTVNGYEAGDHLIIIGEVTNLHKNDVEPMIYYQREMGVMRKEFIK